jgi:hypothetical protein
MSGLLIENGDEEEQMEIEENALVHYELNNIIGSLSSISLHNKPFEEAVPMLEQIQVYAGNVYDIVNAEHAGIPIVIDFGEVGTDGPNFTVQQMVKVIKLFSKK